MSAWAAWATAPAEARGPSSATVSVKVDGPRLLDSTTG
jgi:hypothetical protein